MCEPFSITAGVVSLLSVCLKLSVELKKLRNGAAEAKTNVTAMLADIKALRSVLELVEESFEEFDSGPVLTGHIGTHWTNLQVLLTDGCDSITKLEELLVIINREVSFLDSTRREMRLKMAGEQIVMHRQEIQAYKDALQLSLQSVTFFHQATIKNDTAKILDSSEAIHQDLGRLATNLEVKLTALETIFQMQNQQDGIANVSHLKDCVRSANMVISSASTALTMRPEEAANSWSFSSEWGDWFRSDLNDLTLKWISSQDSQPLPLTSIPEPVTSAKAKTTSPKLADSSFSPFSSDIIQTLTSGPRSAESNPLSRLTITKSSSSDDATRGKERLEYGPNKENNSKEGDKDTRSKSTSSLKADPDIRVKHKKSRSLSAIFGSRSREEKQKSHKRKEEGIPTTRDLQVDKKTGMIRLKFVFVGDGACGKTCFLIRASRGVMPEVYVPTVFENYIAEFNVDGISIEAALWDTAGQEDFDRMRPLSYTDAHVFCICFAVDSPDSLLNVKEKWVSEISRFNKKNRPVFLLGFKSDVRHDPERIGELMSKGERPVSIADGEEVHRLIGAVSYFDCSAKTGQGVAEVLPSIVRKIPEVKAKQKRKFF